MKAFSLKKRFMKSSIIFLAIIAHICISRSKSNEQVEVFAFMHEP